MRTSVDTLLLRIFDHAYGNDIIEFWNDEAPEKDKVGTYFSALSNEACLKGAGSAWIVLGVGRNGHLSNSYYLDSADGQKELTEYIRKRTSRNMTFLGIHERTISGHRIAAFEIPPACDGAPTEFEDAAYERCSGSVRPLGEENRRRIWSMSAPDWSAATVDSADLDDLDPVAVTHARDIYMKSRPSQKAECAKWDDSEFLENMGLTTEGKLTNSALLLLGRPDSADKMDIPPAGIRWILKGPKDATVDTEDFGMPYILSLKEVCEKIRNYEFTVKDAHKGHAKVQVYGMSLIYEALCNCICHQDYTRSEKITVIEHENRKLAFINAGDFLPGNISDIMENNGRSYPRRNAMLAKAMCRLGITEIAGAGIIKMYKCQIYRGFPMPVFETENGHVAVTVTGKKANRAYTDILSKHPDLRVRDVAAIDAVISGRSISETEEHRLILMGFAVRDGNGLHIIDPGMYYTAAVPTLEEIRNAILVVLRTKGPMDKRTIATIMTKGPLRGISAGDAYVKVTNALSSLMRNGSIRNIGTDRKAIYEVVA